MVKARSTYPSMTTYGSIREFNQDTWGPRDEDVHSTYWESFDTMSHHEKEVEVARMFLKAWHGQYPTGDYPVGVMVRKQIDDAKKLCGEA